MGITIRCLAHASSLLKTENQIMHIDPSTKYTGLSMDEFEPADLILVTHSHGDHCDPKLLKKIRKMGSPIIAPASCKEMIKGGGIV